MNPWSLLLRNGGQSPVTIRPLWIFSPSANPSQLPAHWGDVRESHPPSQGHGLVPRMLGQRHSLGDSVRIPIGELDGIRTRIGRLNRALLSH